MTVVDGDRERFDAVVIGVGQGGKPLAIALARAGWKTAVIEKEHVGGACINNACTPTKTMVASARVAYLARRAADYGVETGPVTVDMAAVRRRKQAMVESFRASTLRALQGADGLELIRGVARFAGAHELDISLNEGGSRRLRADSIFIDTGTRPVMPALPGLDRIAPLDSISVQELDEAPGHLLVLGAGPVGVEFGQMFRRFGSDVTLIERSEQLLPAEDEDVAQALEAVLREDGLGILLGARALEVRPGGPGVELLVSAGGERRTLEGTHLLVAAGRAPVTEDLDLATAGVETDERGFIVVDERLQTSVAGVYALGDVKGGPAFTHISYDDFRIIRTNLLEDGRAGMRDRLVPYTIFTDPQLGRVGLTERQARQAGLDIKVATLPMDWISRALEVDESRGMMKAIVDADSDRILGCAALGIEGGELMAMIEIAMMGGLSAGTLREGVFAHPTLAESLNSLFASV